MTKQERKDYNVLTEMYRRAFAASTPKGDFDQLVECATFNELGQKIIPFLEYECEQEVMEQIVKDVLKENKIPKHRHQLFLTSFMLGCSPKTKQNK